MYEEKQEKSAKFDICILVRIFACPQITFRMNLLVFSMTVLVLPPNVVAKTSCDGIVRTHQNGAYTKKYKCNTWAANAHHEYMKTPSQILAQNLLQISISKLLPSV